MKKQKNLLIFSLLAASVAGLSIGCASSGYARYDDDQSDAMGVSAGAEVGTDADLDADVDIDTNDADIDIDTDRNYRSDYRSDNYRSDLDLSEDEASSRSTVSALSFGPETRPTHVNKWPFYDWNVRVIETYTFAVPDPDLSVTTTSDYPEFSANLAPGSVFVEAAGGEGEVRAGRVIQHSPNPVR